METTEKTVYVGGGTTIIRERDYYRPWRVTWDEPWRRYTVWNGLGGLLSTSGSTITYTPDDSEINLTFDSAEDALRASKS